MVRNEKKKKKKKPGLALIRNEEKRYERVVETPAGKPRVENSLLP